MSDTPRVPATSPGTADGPLADIDGIMRDRAERLHEADDRCRLDEERRQQFLADFAAVRDDQIRPAMEAVIDRLRADGGGGEIEEGHGDSGHPSDPRLTAWLSLEGDMVGHPRLDRNPYLQLVGESSDRVVQVSEGNLWQGRGSRSGRVASWRLSETTPELVTEHLVAILWSAAS